jgi:hypothetical protein
MQQTPARYFKTEKKAAQAAPAAVPVAAADLK